LGSELDKRTTKRRAAATDLAVALGYLVRHPETALEYSVLKAKTCQSIFDGPWCIHCRKRAICPLSVEDGGERNSQHSSDDD